MCCPRDCYQTLLETIRYKVRDNAKRYTHDSGVEIEDDVPEVELLTVAPTEKLLLVP
jgi:hypothetical protein